MIAKQQKETFYRLCNHDVLLGNPASMLKGRNSVVNNVAISKKYLGIQTAVDNTIKIEVDESFVPFLVTGVVKTPPLNSSVRHNYFMVNLADGNT